MSRLRSLLRTDLLPSVLSGAGALTIYLRTLTPSVSIIDSGELAAVACTLGIAHPTGYPLFTLLGRLFAMLPLAAEPIMRLNIMAAVFTATGVGVLCHLLMAFLRLLQPKTRSRPAAVRAAAMGGALLFAFSPTVWAQAVAVEVYALHILLVALILRMVVRAEEARLAGESRESARAWMLGALLLGLSFGNHMTTVLLLPAIIVGFLASNGRDRAARRLAASTVAWMAIGLSIYLYLPLRASQEPMFSWGDVTSLERLLWHVSGKQYRVWIFSSWDVAGTQMEKFVGALPGELTIAGLLLAILGLMLALRWRSRVALLTLLAFATCVGYAINYDIHDIDAYFLLAYLVLAAWAAVALLGGLRLVPGRIPDGVLWVGALIIPVGLLASGYDRADRSEDFMVEDYTEAVFASVEPNGVVLSYQWDFWLSASYYYQAVEGKRTDIAVVDKELLRRSWYLTELERRYPALMGAVAPEMKAFREELHKFEHGLPYNGAIIQRRFVEMIARLLRTAMQTRPVYVTAEIEPEFTAGLQRVPVGPLFQLFADTLFHPTPRPEFVYRPIVREDDYGTRLQLLYAEALMARARYYLAHGNVREAEESASQAARHRRRADLSK